MCTNSIAEHPYVNDDELIMEKIQGDWLTLFIDQNMANSNEGQSECMTTSFLPAIDESQSIIQRVKEIQRF